MGLEKGANGWGPAAGVNLFILKGCLEIGELQLKMNRNMNGAKTMFKTAGPVI